MKREDLFNALFEWEDCEPSKKAEKQQAYQALLAKAVEETGRSLLTIQSAIEQLYPAYRSKRIRNEIPNVPFPIREE